MSSKIENIALIRCINSVNKINLDPIAELLKSKTDTTPQWSKARIETAIQEYRRMLVLVALNVEIVPCPDVDMIWHQHILHTRQYADDCNQLFNTFLHHTPTDHSPQAISSLRTKYRTMLNHYQEIFEQSPHPIWDEPKTDALKQIPNTTKPVLEEPPSKKVKTTFWSCG